MKKYLLAQLTQVSAWIGFLIILGSFLLPREYIAFFGLALILTDDEALKNWVVSKSPWLEKKINEIADEL